MLVLRTPWPHHQALLLQVGLWQVHVQTSYKLMWVRSSLSFACIHVRHGYYLNLESSVYSGAKASTMDRRGKNTNARTRSKETNKKTIDVPAKRQDSPGPTREGEDNRSDCPGQCHSGLLGRNCHTIRARLESTWTPSRSAYAQSP